MRTIPTDSADAAELREAAAEQEAAADALEVQSRRDHAERCRRGWLGEDSEGRPVPCSICRPHLLQVACHTCGTSATACQTRTGVRRGACCDRCSHTPTSEGASTR